MKVIVFINDASRVSIVSPFPDCDLTIEEIADKDIPVVVLERDDRGIPIKTEPRQYLIIDDSELPDRELRDQWAISDGKLIVDSTISTALLPDWQSLYVSLLSGNLRLIFNAVTEQAIANPPIAVGLIHVNSAIAQIKIEQALADALNVLQLSGFTFTKEYKYLWNSEMATLNFSDLVKLK